MTSDRRRPPDWSVIEPGPADVTTILLRGHLLVEQELFAIVSERCVNPAALDDLRIGFPVLAGMALALVESTPERAWLWLAISQLNAIRNAIAHSIRPPKLMPRLKELFELTNPRLREVIGDTVLYTWDPNLPSNAARAAVYAILSGLAVLHVP